MNAELSSYVREALARGVGRDAIHAQLAAARWRAEEIEAALGAWADGEGGVPVPRRSVSLSAREAFQHLVLFATLYIFTFDVGALLFTIIDRWLRDAVMSYRDPALATLRWSTAGAITALPIHLWVNRIIERELAREPEKRSSGVRRWLTYLTLFVAALVLIGDFSTLVSHALGGELTTRFVLKSLVVFAIAGAVFGHFLGGLKREEVDVAVGRRVSWIGRAGVAAAIAAIVAGLASAGGPARARLRSLDGQRVNDLEMIHGAVESYYQARHALPRSMSELGESYSYAGTRNDPVSGSPYGYAYVDSVTYRLSARFATAETLYAGGEPIPPAWRHHAGAQVFTRHVSGMPVPPRP
jgi:hypothetical protein